MTRNRLRKLGLAGVLAIGGLVLAPLAASADVNKCSKDLTKNAAKVTTDVQKELAKCVDGWLKEEDKVSANYRNGKLNWAGEGEAASLNKAADKCEKSLLKILQWATRQRPEALSGKLRIPLYFVPCLGNNASPGHTRTCLRYEIG